MRRLTHIRLINWYHYEDTTVPLQGSTLLIGDNGSGKSTIMDAVQLALVADLSQVRFNRAANEQSRRTLYSYVRWKQGSEDERDAGRVRYARGACASYLLLRFEDDENPAGTFVCGTAMEANEVETHVPREFFVAPGMDVGDVPVVVDAIVQPMRDFRKRLRQSPRARVIPDVATYRAELRQRLGPLPESFHSLLVKALDFRPLGQVRDFVMKYLLDERPINTAPLLANLEHYRQMDAQARQARERIESLGRVVELGQRIERERRVARGLLFKALRAEIDLAQGAVEHLKDEIERAEGEHAQLSNVHQRLNDRVTFLDREHQRLLGILAGSAVHQQLIQLRRDLDQAQRDHEEAIEAGERARRLLAAQLATLDALFSPEVRDLRRARPELFPHDSFVGLADPPEIVARLRRTLAAEGALAGRDLNTWLGRLEKAEGVLRQVLFTLGERRVQLEREVTELRKELDELDRGQVRYPTEVRALRHLFDHHLKTHQKPRLLCELVDVANERWRDAVEGYLSGRRFDLIVAPDDFERALRIFERHKRDYTLPGEPRPVFIGGVGIVDVERMLDARPRCDPLSLAAQVTTDDPFARAYCDYVMGDVICVDSERDLRGHRRAITDTVLVYQNHVARQTRREVFQQHFIGEAARERRRKQLVSLITSGRDEGVRLATQEGAIREVVQQCSTALREAAWLPELIEAAAHQTALAEQVTLLRRQIESVDRSEIRALEDEMQLIQTNLHEAREQKEAASKQLGALGEKIENRKETLTAGEDTAKTTLRNFRNAFPVDEHLELLAEFEEEYRSEAATRSLVEIRDNFGRQAEGYNTRIAGMVNRLVQLKTEYANGYGTLGGTEPDAFAEFEQELRWWVDSKLPEYQQKIKQAQEQAKQQLAEDIIFQLRESFALVHRTFGELNRALKDLPFGNERYQFTVEVGDGLREFHNLIDDAGRFERDSLFGAAAREDPNLLAALERMVAQLVAAEPRQVKTELERITDYREYFEYDLKIHRADGTWALYSRTAGDNSGGETQTPFYVAVFASLYHMYRSQTPDHKPRCGLILLDEAFAKMDEHRIRGTLTFAHDLGLQLLMAMPKEKTPYVAPHVQTSLYVHRNPRTGRPQVLDFTKVLAEEDVADSDAGPGAETLVGAA